MSGIAGLERVKARGIIQTNKIPFDDIGYVKGAEMPEGNLQLNFGEDFSCNLACTLEEYACRYIYVNESHKRLSTRNRDLVAFRTIIPALGNKTLWSITKRDIEDYQTNRAEIVSASTVNRDMETLKHLLSCAVESGIIQVNPASKVKNLKVEPFRERYLTFKEKEELLKACKNNIVLHAVVLTALETGMRRGEIMNLEWKSVDFNLKQITLTQTKNNEKRSLPITDRLFQELYALWSIRQSDYVFEKPDGTRYGDWKKSFATACRRAGIDNFRFHDLRHTFASHLRLLGVDLGTIRELLGHKSLQMTMRYAHISDIQRYEAVSRLAHGTKKKADEWIRTTDLRFTKALLPDQVEVLIQATQKLNKTLASLEAGGFAYADNACAGGHNAQKRRKLRESRTSGS